MTGVNLTTQKQRKLWRARCDALEAGRGAPGILDDVVGYPYSEYRDATRLFIGVLKPYFRRDAVEGAAEVWREVDLATGDVPIDDNFLHISTAASVDPGQWVGIQSVYEADAGAQIPRYVLDNAVKACQWLMLKLGVDDPLLYESDL